MTNAPMVYTGTDAQGFACFADTAVSAPGFAIPVQAVALCAVSKVSKGEYVRFTENGPVWVRGAYDRASKVYSFTAFDDTNKERFAKGTKKVFVGFTF